MQTLSTEEPFANAPGNKNDTSLTQSASHFRGCAKPACCVRRPLLVQWIVTVQTKALSAALTFFLVELYAMVSLVLPSKTLEKPGGVWGWWWA